MNMRICYQSKRRKGNSLSFQGLETANGFQLPFYERYPWGGRSHGEELEVGIIPGQERGFPTLLCPPACESGRIA